MLTPPLPSACLDRCTRLENVRRPGHWTRYLWPWSWHRGKYEQAEEMRRQELGLRETVLGKEHPDTLTSVNNLAGVVRDQDKYEQAEEICW